MPEPIFPLIEQSFEDIVLKPLDVETAAFFAENLARVSPWSELGWTPEKMKAGLTAAVPSVFSFHVEAAGQVAGLAILQAPWLAGPYLQRLAVLPAFQGQGTGSKILRWIEHRAREAKARHIWLCVTRTNLKAIKLYERHGFSPSAILDDLICAGMDEILMRKKLF